ncbi:MAG TPA: RDD family protein [Nitrospiria bacterium]
MTEFSGQDPDDPQGANPWPLFPEKKPEEIPETSLIPGSHYAPAGFFRRVFAFGFDLAVIEWLTLLFIGVGFLARETALGPVVPMGFRDPFSEWAALHSLAWSFLFISYFTFFTFYGGQSPGKILFRIRVMMGDGGPVPVLRALLRVGGYYLNALTLGAGFLLALVSPSNRALHDYLAGTVVGIKGKT